MQTMEWLQVIERPQIKPPKCPNVRQLYPGSLRASIKIDNLGSDLIQDIQSVGCRRGQQMAALDNEEMNAKDLI